MWKGDAHPRLTQRCTSWYGTFVSAVLTRRAKAVGPLCASTRREIAGVFVFMPAIIPQQKRVRKFLLCLAQPFVVPDHFAMTLRDETIGQRIIAELERQEISQAEFCRRINVSTESLRKWATGETAPTRKRRLVIAAELKRSDQWVQFGTDTSEQGPGSLVDNASPPHNAALGLMSDPPVMGGSLHGLQVATTQTPQCGITWELYVNMLREGVDLSAGVWVVITDDANAPEINPNDECYITPGDPKPGALAVFRTGDGDILLRRYRKVTSSRFEAVAVNPGYATLNSTTDQLALIGVVTKHMRTL